MYELSPYVGRALQKQEITVSSQIRREGYRDAIGFLRGLTLSRLLASHPIDLIADEIEVRSHKTYWPDSYDDGWRDLLFELETWDEG